MIRRLSLLALLLASLSPCARAEGIAMQSVALENGLSQSTITAIAEGPEGFLWIGTPDGLHRYDGYEFVVYHEGDGGLNDDHITALGSSPAGGLWVGTRYDGVFAYDPDTRDFTPVLAPDEISHASVTSLAVDAVGAVWIGTDTVGVLRLDPVTGETRKWPHDPLSSRSLSSPHVAALAVGRRGTVFVGTDDRGLNIISVATGEVRVFRSLVGAPAPLPSDRITALFVDRDDGLLVGTATGAVGWFDPDAGLFSAVGEGALEKRASGAAGASEGDESIGPITAILESRGGDVWVATSTTLVRFRDGALPTPVAGATRVQVLYEDASGVVWSGARAGGLSRHSPRTEQFSRFLDATGPGELGALVWSFAEAAGGSVWVGADDGLFRLDPGSAARAAGQAPGPSAEVERISVPAIDSFPVHDLFFDGTLWLALESGGAAQIDTDGRLLRRIGSSSPASLPVLSVYTDGSRAFLGTAGDGLHVVGAAGSRQRYSTAAPGSFRGGETVYAIESAGDGTLWLGTDAAAILRFDPETGAIRRYRLFEEPGRGVAVWGIEPTRDGAVWIAAREGGAILFHPDEGVRLRLEPGVDFPGDIVYAVIVDGVGAVWLTTNEGLLRVDEATGETQQYTAADGMGASEFSSGAAMLASDGTIYTGGINGLTRFDPRRVRPSTYLPPIVVTRLADSSGKPISRTNPTLPPGMSGFSLAVSSLDFNDPGANRYSYRLVPHDDAWRTPEVDRTIRYTDLPRGDYRLYLRGSNSDGIWNYEGATLDITVLPRFWQTELFIVGAMVLAIVLVSLGLYRRLRRADNERIELEQSVAQRTMDLEASKRAMEREVAARKRVEESLREARDELENRVAFRTDALVREVQERKEAQQRTDRALRENEALLQEIHHRVKNNMQIISSLLHLQSARVADESARHGFEISRQRISAMALIHERLYQTRDFSSVDMGEYFESLISSLASLHGRAFSVETRVEASSLDIARATPCGLITNELVTNAMKHAFVDAPPSGPRSIRIEFVEDGEMHRLTVADNGVGVRDSDGLSNATSLGLRIVDVLVDQLEGELTVVAGPDSHFGRGFEFTVRF